MMKNNSLKWYLISITLFIFFLFCTTINLYHTYGYILIITESIICVFFIILGLNKLKDFNELLYSNLGETISNNSYLLIASILISGIILSFTLEKRTDNEIIANGIFTKAIITDGHMEVSKSVKRTFTSYELNIVFNSKDGQEHNILTKVDKEVYESLSKNLSVEIKYLPSNPAILKIISGNSNVQKFKNITNRNVTFFDLEKILKSKNLDIENYLNKISNGWEIRKKDSSIIYENIIKNEIIIVSSENWLMYSGSEISDIENFIPSERIIIKSDSIAKNKVKIGTVNFELDNLIAIYKTSINDKMNIENSLIIKSK
ncbi:hypothetical protein SAMN05444143_1254 [Flavobacterium succinicans]|uniref:Uncharacterized protein n=2 Tax=Flavobacterium succinicans TaxID=29536 RepID=A0A1I5A506_9FLAO|nr:hypothetical protein SAMN05444143_1254 [Flavobacterium succinicans]